MPIGPDKFRHALSKFASGVTVVTTRDAAGNPHGITVSAFCSVSLEPPLILICIEKAAGSHYAFGESGVFVVNVLGENQMEYSNRFAAPTDDKFADIDCTEGIGGVPVLQNTLAALECRVTDTCDGGDHTIFIGEIEKATVKEGRPLIYFHGKYRAIEELYDIK